LQNQDDCNFTVVALLPTLGTQLLEAMDVEKVTRQLQEMSSNAKATVAEAPHSENAPAQITPTDGTEPTSSSDAASNGDSSRPSLLASSSVLANGDATRAPLVADPALVDSIGASSLSSSAADIAATGNGDDATASTSHFRLL
jgi:peroxin-3